MKRELILLVSFLTFLVAVGTVTAVGNGWIGYHENNIFVGTGLQWCQQKYPTWPGCVDYLGAYVNDKIVMKWNAEWERGNAEGWANPPYAAWTDNEWNGKFKGGSGAVWHYKIKWDAGCAESGVPSVGGNAYCIWGQFATIMDQGVDPSMGPGHIWFAHGIPNGYGAN